jgi:hypothetical protein
MSTPDFEYKYNKMFRADEDRTRLLISGIIATCVVVLVVLAATFTPDPATAQAVLREAGFSEGVVTESGGIAMRCGSGDAYYYRLRAKNPKGELSDVTICCGIFKDCTIRY